MNHKEMMQALLDGRTVTHKIEGGEFRLDPETSTLKSTRDIQVGLPPYPDNWSIKSRTININGFEVPEPERTAPEEETLYFMASILDGVLNRYWTGCTGDYDRLQRGVIHLTKEAAELHAAALLSFTKL